MTDDDPAIGSDEYWKLFEDTVANIQAIQQTLLDLGDIAAAHGDYTTRALAHLNVAILNQLEPFTDAHRNAINLIATMLNTGPEWTYDNPIATSWIHNNRA